MSLATFCGACGSPVDNGDRYCRSCGAGGNANPSLPGTSPAELPTWVKPLAIGVAAIGIVFSLAPYILPAMAGFSPGLINSIPRLLIFVALIFCAAKGRLSPVPWLLVAATVTWNWSYGFISLGQTTMPVGVHITGFTANSEAVSPLYGAALVIGDFLALAMLALGIAILMTSRGRRSIIKTGGTGSRVDRVAVWGFAASFFSSPTGLVLGITSLVDIHRAEGTLRGKGLAIAAIAVSSAQYLLLTALGLV
jgi:hypothetical protein